MRWAALLHDAAKPQTRDFLPDGRVTFLGHDVEGAQLARDVLGRLRSSQKLRDYVAALIAHHLDAGFLVHRRPLDRRTIWRYLSATRPYSEDITIFTVADRLATRGRNAERAIEAHLDVADTLIAAAREPVGKPLVRGDELAQIAKGPRLGEILAQLEEDRFAGVISTREEALARARELRVSIEFATREDAPEVLRIINAAYEHGEAEIWEPGWARTTVDEVEHMIAAGEIAVTKDDGRIVGSVRVRRLDDETAELGMLSVDPAAMGGGRGAGAAGLRRAAPRHAVHAARAAGAARPARPQAAAARVVQPPRVSPDFRAGVRRALARRSHRHADLSQEPACGARDLSASPGTDVDREQQGGDAEFTR